MMNLLSIEVFVKEPLNHNAKASKIYATPRLNFGNQILVTSTSLFAKPYVMLFQVNTIAFSLPHMLF